MKLPTLATSTIDSLMRERLSELFLLERLRREEKIVKIMKKESLARLESMRNKIWWNQKQRAAENKA